MYGKRSGGLYRSRPPGPAPNGAAPSPDAPRGGRPQNGAQNGDHPAPQQNGADAAKNGGPDAAKNGELYVTTSTAEIASATSRDNMMVETGSASSAVNTVNAQAPGAGSTAPDVPGTIEDSLISSGHMLCPDEIKESSSRPGSGSSNSMLGGDAALMFGGPVQQSQSGEDFGPALGGGALPRGPSSEDRVFADPQPNGADAAKNGELYVTTSTAEAASATSRDNIRVETGSASSAVNRVKAQEAPGAAEGSTARPDVPGGTMKNSLIISRPGSGCGKNMLEEDVIGGPVQTSPKNFSTKGDFGSSLGGAAPFTEARDPCGTCRVGRLRFCGFFCSEKSALPPHSQS